MKKIDEIRVIAKKLNNIKLLYNTSVFVNHFNLTRNKKFDYNIICLQRKQSKKFIFQNFFNRLNNFFNLYFEFEIHF